MAFIPTTNCARVGMQFSQEDGEFAENVFAVQRSAAWTVGLLNTLAAAFNTWWHVGDGAGDTYQGPQANTVHLLATSARDLTTISSPSVVVPWTGSPAAGGATGKQLPNGVTFSLTARTGLAGRSFRGRSFVIGLTVDDQDATDPNIIKSSRVSELILAFNSLITAVTAADANAKLAVLSTRTGNAPRVSGVTTPITTYGNHNLFFDYQRRRAPAHNRHH